MSPRLHRILRYRSARQRLITTISRGDADISNGSLLKIILKRDTHTCVLCARVCVYIIVCECVMNVSEILLARRVGRRPLIVTRRMRATASTSQLTFMSLADADLCRRIRYEKECIVGERLSQLREKKCYFRPNQPGFRPHRFEFLRPQVGCRPGVVSCSRASQPGRRSAQSLPQNRPNCSAQ